MVGVLIRFCMILYQIQLIGQMFLSVMESTSFVHHLKKKFLVKESRSPGPTRFHFHDGTVMEGVFDDVFFQYNSIIELKDIEKLIL